MKNKTVLIIVIISLLSLNLNGISAEERSIYVGDIIELTIDSNNYSMSDIESAFKDFEIIELKEEDQVYQLKIRSFEVGDHIVNLGDNEITISVVSLLSEDKTDLIPGQVVMPNKLLVMPWTIIKYISLLVAGLSFIIFLAIIIKNRPKKPGSIYEVFMDDLSKINIDSQDYAYDLTSLFKSYTATKLNKKIQGLTTSELIVTIDGLAEVKDSFDLIASWLNKCDTFKYSKDKANPEAKETLKNQLLTIVQSIEENSEVIK